jgi:hypothetical protein
LSTITFMAVTNCGSIQAALLSKHCTSRVKFLPLLTLKAAVGAACCPGLSMSSMSGIFSHLQAGSPPQNVQHRCQ